MIKSGLKDMKFHNRRLLLRSVIESSSTSRISLARETGLSPSTVSTLVVELIEEGVLVESGLTVPTSGRSRKEICLNPDYGQIVVIELRRRQTNLCVYDIFLNKVEEKLIALHRMSGNSLFSEICEALENHFVVSGSYPLLGIGLLYMEDMIQSDLKVMFSTSVSAENISLRDALYTRFKVPVEGEYSSDGLLGSPLKTTETKNSAHIAIASKILVSVTINGQPLKLKGGLSADITRLMPVLDLALPESAAGTPAPLFAKIAYVLTFLASIFPLDLIFLSGRETRRGGFQDHLRQVLAFMPGFKTLPPIELLETPENSLADTMAARLRDTVFKANFFPGG
ncbi:MAG: winged helix-turn-helix domain-containing protein [Spirochaetaceae bacterium]|jgi:DNA-binding Lrp family transcriptional regulator|nr:winged helix-turn-helix domain-containing protein [Spirochaetaceae bacterium]